MHSLASQFQKLTAQGGLFRQQMMGEEIVIYEADGTTVGATVQASVNIAASASTLAEGGFYLQDAMSVEVLTSDLAGFIPAAEMYVDARGKAMRIAPDGVTPGLTLFRLTLIPRHAPAR